MEEILHRLAKVWALNRESFIYLIDITLVTLLIFRVLRMIRGTRAWRILGGIVIFVLALLLSDYFELRTLHWMLEKATMLAPDALVILLLPELRQTLESFGKLGLWPGRLPGGDGTLSAKSTEEIVAAVAELGATRTGALIVIERNIHLDDITASGVPLDAAITSPFLGSVFFENNPLHDGALVVRADRAVAAACRLPLSESRHIDASYHMRHRAGIGITEQSDAISIIVSEERGSISVAQEGELIKLDSHNALRDFLNTEVRGVRDGEKSKKRLISFRGGGS